MTDPRGLDAKSVAIVGGGPAGLMAAEALVLAAAEAGSAPPRIDLYDRMPSVGRKFLLAGKGGLNLTHSEPFDDFVGRYGDRVTAMRPLLDALTPLQLREWAMGLGIETFVGSSRRVFPKDMKAAPLLRAWLHRLRAAQVVFHMRHRWCGWQPRSTGAAQQLQFESATGLVTAGADAVILALGGASWARLGSDGAWVETVRDAGVDVLPLLPSNCGFDVDTRHADETGDPPREPGWSVHFQDRFAGSPVKSVVASASGPNGDLQRQQGEFVVTRTGLEGSLVYALSASLRDAITRDGHATLHLDLAPSRPLPRLQSELSRPRGAKSMSNHLRACGIEDVKAGLLRDIARPADFADPSRLAALIKSLPIRLVKARPIDEAISSAGGVAFPALDGQLMSRVRPGVFFAGEMLDWEAPTGGYLLTAAMASGRVAGLGACRYLMGH